MKLLTKNEELFMLTILRLNKPVTLPEIRQHLLENTGKDWAFASIYMTLDKLDREGLVKVTSGEPQPYRGGKALNYYSVNEKGVEALQKEKEVKDRMWMGFPYLVKKKLKNGS
jgi:DNA-binding PadR family transcriptional regulator